MTISYTCVFLNNDERMILADIHM